MSGEANGSGSKLGPRGCPVTEHDVFLFHEGTHCQLFDKLGAQPATIEGGAVQRLECWRAIAETRWKLGFVEHLRPRRSRRSPLQVPR